MTDNLTTPNQPSGSPCNCGMGCNPFHPPCKDYQPSGSLREQIEHILGFCHHTGGCEYDKSLTEDGDELPSLVMEQLMQAHESQITKLEAELLAEAITVSATDLMGEIESDIEAVPIEAIKQIFKSFREREEL